jgi:hypothetical protein
MALVTVASAQADLIGTSVTGQMLISGTNYFESANGYVPAGYDNSGLGTSTTVTIDSGIEFGFHDGSNTDTADFTGTTLTLQDVSVNNSIGITYIFTDTAFTGFSLSSNTFPSSVTATLVGDVLTLNAPAISSSGTYDAVYNLSTTASAPEPGTVFLTLPVLLAIIFLAKRRMAATN